MLVALARGSVPFASKPASPRAMKTILRLCLAMLQHFRRRNVHMISCIAFSVVVFHPSPFAPPVFLLLTVI